MADDTPPPDLDAIILDVAANPRRVAGDAGSVEEHSLQDLIAAKKFLAGVDAGKSPRRGLRFTKLIPPGTA